MASIMGRELPQSWKVIVFTMNLLVGLIVSQVAGATMGKDAYKTWSNIVIGATMWCLSFIMINVGYEFTIDKKALNEYVWDYLIAMTAAGFPWLFAALWFYWALGVDIPISEALLVARFSAPTSAGILFSMLDAAGLHDTWLFQKARILAIFDDLDTILLMIPLKVVLVGFKWELGIAVGIMAILLAVAWFKLHAIKIPYSWPWTLAYSAVIAFICKILYILTKYHIDMEPIHLEVLLPAFVLGCVIDTPCAQHELQLQRKMSQIRRSLTLHRKETKLALEAAKLGLEVAKPASHSGDLGTDVIKPTSRQGPGKEHIVASDDAQCCNSSKSTQDTHETGPAQPHKAAMLPGSVENVADDDGLETIYVDSSPHDPRSALPIFKPSAEEGPAAVSAGGQQQQGDPRVVSPKATAAWSQEKKKPGSQTIVVPVTSEGRSGSKQSNRSTQSKSSGASMTRYGHSRNDVHNKSLEPEAEPNPGHHEHESEWEAYMQTAISMVFMVLVGLSMPALIGKNAKDNSGGLSAGTIVLHVFCISVLMVAGKMFPACCYRDEAPLQQRIALCLGMCPRGEVGASIIVISLELGVEGPAIIIAMCALGGNLIMSGGFIGAVKYLLRGAPSLGAEGGEQVIQSA